MDWNALIEFDKQLLLMLNGSDSLFLDGLVKTLTTATTWIPLYVALLYMVIKNNDTMAKIGLIIACAGLCVLFAGSVDDLFVKPTVARWRPSHDPEIGILVDTVNGYRGGDYGFFSAHASNTFSIAIFFSLLVRSQLLTCFLVLWSLVNCWTRMYLGVHYPGDILVGLLWGGTVGTAVWCLHSYVTRRWLSTSNYISRYYTPSGYQYVDIDAVITVLVLSFIYAVLRGCYFLYV